MSNEWPSKNLDGKRLKNSTQTQQRLKLVKFPTVIRRHIIIISISRHYWYDFETPCLGRFVRRAVRRWRLIVPERLRATYVRTCRIWMNCTACMTYPLPLRIPRHEQRRYGRNPMRNNKVCDKTRTNRPEWRSRSRASNAARRKSIIIPSNCAASMKGRQYSMNVPVANTRGRSTIKIVGEKERKKKKTIRQSSEIRT